MSEAPSVLIVDDDEDLSDLLAECLRAEGFEVRYAPNGAAGLRALTGELPDVIVLDIDMPVLDGPGMVGRLFIEDRGKERIPIVLVSGASSLAQVVMRVGTPYSVAKPYEIDGILAVLRRALVERKAPAPARP